MSQDEKRIRFSLTLSEDLIRRLESRIPEVGRSRQDVIERLLIRFWEAKTEIVDAIPNKTPDLGASPEENTREVVGERHRPTRS